MQRRLDEQAGKRARPILLRLMDDSPAVAFTVAEREIAARWVIKTAMVFEAVGGAGANWFYSQEERAVVRAGSIPSGYTAFWAARCVNLPGAYVEANNMFESAEISDHWGFMVTSPRSLSVRSPFKLSP